MSNRRNDGFQRALDEARRQNRALNDDGSGPVGSLRVRARLELGPAAPSGGEARFGLALDWTDEPAERLHAPRDEAQPDPADAAAEIAAELGLGGSLTPEQLVSGWRNFVWRNHPDRQPAHERDRAGARVAIANALYDKARRGLVKRG
jgi:hypothetical protein